MPRTVYRSCHLCEASCGLQFEVEGDQILSVRPDKEDVFSQGYVCPKGIAIADVHHDPDRVRQPLQRQADGSFQPITWDVAFDLVESRLKEVRGRYGADAIGVYIGNPVVHNHGALMVRGGLLKAIGTRNCFSAGSQDTSPRFAASNLLFGSSFSVPIPDLERTDYFLCIGANPLISNGSLLTAPNMKARLRAIRERGGRIVVVDPRRSETAREADEHVPIRPGGDAALLLAMAQVLVADGKVDRNRLSEQTRGWPAVEQRLAAFTPAMVAAQTGIAAATIERLARDFAAASRPVAYSRVGVCNNRFGTLASYATDLLNLVTGRLGAEGGAMFSSPAFDLVPLSRMLGADGYGRWRSRVRGLPETLGDLPAATMAEEMETPGNGQIRALITYAGNPVLSTPNGQRLDRALGQLDFMVSVDIYVNETSRHADVILPPCGGLAEDHIDLFFSSVYLRNIARWSPPVVEKKPGERADWEILLELAERMGGGPTGVAWMDGALRWTRKLGYRWEPTKSAEMSLRIGPYGDRFLPGSKGLNLRKLKDAPHGIDLGALQAGYDRRVFHGDRKIHIDAPQFLTALDELSGTLTEAIDELLLIGRRELRTCNSWMHNVPDLVSGRERCVLYVHPDDAGKAGVADGDEVQLESRVHRGNVRVQVTDEVMPGVVSLPHGWGHAASAPWQRVAGERPGVSANDWTDDQRVESIVGQSILNGVPVRLRLTAAQRSSGDDAR